MALDLERSMVRHKPHHARSVAEFGAVLQLAYFLSSAVVPSEVYPLCVAIDRSRLALVVAGWTCR